MGTASEKKTKSVAIMGAGAAGTVTAAAFKAENHFEAIHVFERRESPGGTWIYDALPSTFILLHPEKYSQTPIYDYLTTNVPSIAMSFSDLSFPYGPVCPHYVPQQYIASYFSHNRTDPFLVLNTTLEDLSKLPPSHPDGHNRWKLTLRKHDPLQNFDSWWEEEFDAVVLANGHYSVPYVPFVPGLQSYAHSFLHKVQHSKAFRSAAPYKNKRVLIIGNSASGHDLSVSLLPVAASPLYISRRSRSRWDGALPSQGVVVWKPTVSSYDPDIGRINFSDGTKLEKEDVDVVIYCTGYQPSFSFWNPAANGRALWDNAHGGKLLNNYQHTFLRDFPLLGMVGVPRVLTLRGFEYQAIVLARYLAGRAALPSQEEQREWEDARMERVRRERKRFKISFGRVKRHLSGLVGCIGLLGWGL